MNDTSPFLYFDCFTDFYEKAIEANVMHGIHELKNKVPNVNQLIEAKKLRVVGAIYDVDTGKVHFGRNQLIASILFRK